MRKHWLIVPINSLYTLYNAVLTVWVSKAQFRIVSVLAGVRCLRDRSGSSIKKNCKTRTSSCRIVSVCASLCYPIVLLIRFSFLSFSATLMVTMLVLVAPFPGYLQ